MLSTGGPSAIVHCLKGTGKTEAEMHGNNLGNGHKLQLGKFLFSTRKVFHHDSDETLAQVTQR